MPLEPACNLLGVTLPSMNAEDCDTRLTCVGVIGTEMLCCNEGGVYELVRLPVPSRGRPPLPLSDSLSKLDFTNSLAIFRTNTALSVSASRRIASKRGCSLISESSLGSHMLRTIRRRLSRPTAFL